MADTTLKIVLEDGGSSSTNRILDQGNKAIATKPTGGSGVPGVSASSPSMFAKAINSAANAAASLAKPIARAAGTAEGGAGVAGVANAAGAVSGIGRLAGLAKPIGGAAIAGVGVAVGAIVAAGVACKKFSDSVTEASVKFAKYSPDIALQRAETNMRRQLTDIDFAQRNGPRIARLQNVKDRASEELSKLQSKVWEQVLRMLDRLMPLFEKGVYALEILNAGIDVAVKKVEDIYTQFTNNNQQQRDAAHRDYLDAMNTFWNVLNGLPNQTKKQGLLMGGPLGMQIFGNNTPMVISPPIMGNPAGPPAASRP